MAGTIRITPQELRDASAYLNARLEAMSIEANSLKGKLDEIGANWEGAAQTSFFEVFYNEMWPVLNKQLPDVINHIRSQLEVTAETLEQTDLEISQQLKS